MSLDLDEFKGDLRGIRDDLPVTFLFSGTYYTGFQSQRVSTEDLQSGGFLDQFDFRLHVPLQVQTSGTWTNTFATEPALGSIIVVTGSGTHKIARLSHSQDGLLLSLGLASMNR